MRNLRLKQSVGLAMVVLSVGITPMPAIAQARDVIKTDAVSTDQRQNKGQLPVPMVEVEFTNAKLQPPRWKLRFDEAGAGFFDAEDREDRTPGAQEDKQESRQIQAGDVHRPVQLSSAFVSRAFATARSRRYFQFPCDSHMKVAFQGTKKLTYSGPDGAGSCEFNYSKDKEIQSLGDALMAVEATLLSGARLEKLLQHDRLGLDEELDNLVEAAHEGNAVELGAIKDTLTRIASDDQVLGRARRKARLLLAQAQGGPAQG